MEQLTNLNPSTKVYLPNGQRTDEVFGVILMPTVAKFEEGYKPVLPDNMEENYGYPHNSYEFYIVCGTKEQRDKFFKDRFEGLVSTKVCRKFNWFENPVDQDEVKEYKLEAVRLTTLQNIDLAKRIGQ